MRKFLAFAALALASCGDKAPTSNNAVAEDGSADQVTAVNDTTAIDAATGEAANMAEDVDYTFNEADGNESSADSKPKAASKAPAKTPAAPPPDEPAVTENSGD